MSVLGTMMLRAGLLSEGQVGAVNEHAAARQISHADAILELGLADEDTLVAFLASKLMIPRVRSSVLERIGSATLARVAPTTAWDHYCIPVSADDTGNLTVVMSDPTDMRAIEAIAEHTNAYLVRAIATASDLRRALIRHYGPEDQVRAQAAAGNKPAESERPTELDLPAVGSDAPPLQAPYPPLGIPDDDDDDVPIRASHGAVEEVISGPHHDSSESAAPSEPPAAAPYVTASPEPTAAPPVEPPAPAAAPYTLERADDPHERPTVIETQQPAPTPVSLPTPPPYATAQPAAAQPSRGPRRPRAHTPWNPPLAGSPPGQPVAAPVLPEEESTSDTLPPPAPVAAPQPTPPVAAPPVAAPQPAPITAPPPSSEPAIPLSPEAFAEVLPRLEVASDRDEVTAVLLDFLAAGFDRVILFVHSHDELRGLDARGKDLLVEAVRQVRIPSGGQSMFATVIERAAPYFGAVQTTHKIDLAFAQALGGVKGNVLLLPVKIGSKVPLLLWAHGTPYPVDPRSINELTGAVSQAILRIIAARRKG